MRARDLQPGTIYRIKNLRLIRRANGAFGRLGGDERLIIEVKDREKEGVRALLRYVLVRLVNLSLTLLR